MTREERINAVLVAARAHIHAGNDALTFGKLVGAYADFLEAERPERPRLMTAETRASLYKASCEGLALCILDDRADIAAKIRLLPRGVFGVRHNTITGEIDINIRDVTASHVAIRLDDVLALLEGK